MLSGRLGPYTLLRQIAVGGMAEIYLAVPGEGTSTQRVAIKVIHPQNATDPDFIRMLIDEAKLAVQLDHPNIVRTYDLGHEHDEYYIVMEFIDGADLFKVQQRAAVKRLSFPVALGAYVTREVLRGLDFAHRLKDAEGRALYIVHRDISPQNVLVSFDGDVKITDFGIAKAAHRAEQTQAGIIKGKYYYMSPEQAMGRIIDARTDIFAAGILLYEMLIGEMLYYDDDLDKLLAMVRKADIVPPSRRRRDVPPALEAIVMKALRKKPDERFQSAEEYGAALDQFLHDFAKSYDAADVGVFVTRVMDEPKDRKRRLSRDRGITASGRRESLDEMEPTLGIGSDQLAALGVRDENSLIFHPDKLQEILSASGEISGQRSSQSLSQSGSMISQARDDDSGLQTRRRHVDKKMEVDPELLEETLSDVGGRREKGERGSWSEEQEGLRTNPVRGADSSDARVTRKHFARQRSVEIGSSSDEVHDRPTMSHDALKSVSAVPVGSSADDEHDSPTARRPVETAHLARVSMEIPALDINSARATYEAETNAVTRRAPALMEEQRALIFEQMPGPNMPSDSQVDLVVSDDGYARISPPDFGSEPKVELTQSDAFRSQNRMPTVSGRPGVDAISNESTQESYPRTEPVQLIRLPMSGASNHRLGYALSGLVAALVSAVVTWQLTTRTLPGRQPVSPDYSDIAADGGTGLFVYPTTEHEPPPAPLSVPLAPPGAPESPTAAPGPERGAARAASDGGSAGQGQGQTGGELEVTSVPEGAEVYVRHKLVGNAPITLHDLPLDSDVKLELRLDGFKKTRKRVKWKGETRLSVEVKMRTGEEAESPDDGAEKPSSGEGQTPAPAPEKSGGEAPEKSEPAKPAEPSAPSN